MDNTELVKQAFEDGIVFYDNHNQRYECKLCLKPMTGTISVEQHLTSKKHDEACARYAIGNLQNAPQSLLTRLPLVIKTAVEEGTIELKDLPGGIKGYLCKVCDKTQTGITPVKQHLEGDDHKKKLKVRQLVLPSPNLSAAAYNSSLPVNTTNPVETTDVSNKPQVQLLLPSTTPINAGYNAAQATNSTNPVEATGFSNINQAQTIPNARTSCVTDSSLPQIERGLKQSSPSVYSNTFPPKAADDWIITYDNSLMKYKCQVCLVTISGDSSGIDQHLNQKAHKEEGAKYAVLHPQDAPQSLIALLPHGAIEAAKAGILIVTATRAFQCLVCMKFATGVAPLTGHLISEDHLRKTGNPCHREDSLRISRNQIPNTELLPDIMNTPVPAVQDIDELAKAFEEGLVICTDDNSDQVMCSICKITLNGNRNLKQHLSGKKHLKELYKVQRSTSSPPDVQQPSEAPAETNTCPEGEGDDHPACAQYRVASDPRGYVYVFNYSFLGGKNNLKERNGAQHDSSNLLQTFKNMGYEVICHEDLSAEETMNTLDQIRQEPSLFQIDSLILFFLSHGNDAYTFYGNDGKTLDLRDIWAKFTAEKCPAMHKKPKIFFTNYCRGKDSEMPEADAIIEVPKDIVTIHAATERITALRSPRHGTHFVWALCEVLNKYADRFLLRDIYHALGLEAKKIGGREPKWEDTRFMKFCFNPKRVMES